MPISYTAGLLRLLILVTYNSKGTDRSLEAVKSQKQQPSSCFLGPYLQAPARSLQHFKWKICSTSFSPVLSGGYFASDHRPAGLQRPQTTVTTAARQLGESSGPGCQGHSQELLVSLINSVMVQVCVGRQGGRASLERSHFAYP